MNDLSPVAIATRQQGRAADPNASVWVSASAGTGKTKVLTDRVLALMLSGTAPHRILCLTFTKAAAAEMANRIAKTLSGWVTAREEGLVADVSRLLDHDPSQQELTIARRLFARVLETPGGMKIETIHAFCQSVLRRFPLEAGLAPHFDLLTDQDAIDLLETARETVIMHAHQGDDDALADALAVIVGRVHELRFPDLMASISFARDKIARVLSAHGGVKEAAMALRRKLGLTDTDTPDTVRRNACDGATVDSTALKEAVVALGGGTKTDQTRATVIAGWLERSTENRMSAFAEYTLAYLTATGTIRAKLATKAVAEKNPAAVDALNTEAERLLSVLDKLRAAEVALATEALLTLGEAFLSEYQVRKAAFARLDYDDLIHSTRALLERPGVAAWVLFKLDGGLDHLLIDEAQDTSPDQWAVVQALTEEFFAGEGRHETRSDSARTVFAVGDRKQSIYSFQGADPNGFDRMRRFYTDRVTQAGQTWADVDLGVSFRSTTAVLRAVDAVFAQTAASDGVTLPDETLVHLAARDGQAGTVELWPPVDPDIADDPVPWKPPVERMRGESAQTRLARLIAKRIANMCTSGELLGSQDRPIRAGDVLVLVRRRTGFVDDLVRALKDLDIPVAGVDRMVLIEQMAVMDLVALGRFLLLPQDDLTLATVLKSPLIGITEEQLFDLAHARGDRTLWAALTEHAGAESPFGEAHRILSAVLSQTDFLGPFALYAHVLTAHDGRRKLLSRLGMDADDPIDEFLSQALEYERRHTPSLEGFLHWLEHGRLEVKRDLEQANRDAVRIMTVHGAKGLQAPIVFLPDTLQIPTHGEQLLWTTDNSGSPLMLWAPSAADRDSITTKSKTDADAARDREYRRLLYVAMTRAEDRLYVCGWNTARTAPQTCWYNLIKTALEPIADTITDPFLAHSGLEDGTVFHLSDAQTTTPENLGIPEDAVPEIPATLPWARQAAAVEPAPPKPLAPSRPATEDPPVAAPLGQTQTNRFQRGLLIHRLLQSLPDLPIDSRRAAADAFLARPVWSLTAEQISAIADETIAVLEHSDFAPLFGVGSKAEVPVTGLINGHVLSGQVDRLVVTDRDVMIVDFKTNRPPPRTVEAVNPAYQFQMAAYRAALTEIYPDRTIRCILLWTDGPFITELPGTMLDAAWDRDAEDD
ncbi:MAG: double-strand break repair helicase AddA [Alphaproteobacteria bacterium]|nr:double-strand break repair helicase AddA [Alphaproteobacteria bacterium]